MTAWLRPQGEADSVALGAKKIDLIPMSFKMHGFDLGRGEPEVSKVRMKQGEDEVV